ncbi:MAG: hypothetical protein ACRESS_05135 [Stenotrophobium sp.]
MTAPKRSAADALLDAHVHFVLNRLKGESLQALVEIELDAALVNAGHLTLNDCVTRKMIKETALTYAADLELGGGIPELVGDIARVLYAHEAHAHTRFGDILSDTGFGEILDKALELKSLRRKLVHEAIANPLYATFASDLLYHGIKGYLAQNAVTRNIPGASSMLKLGKSVMSKATPGLEASIEDSLKKYISKTVRSTTSGSAKFLLDHADDDTIREIAFGMWDRLKHSKIAVLRDDISSLDVEDGFVSAYEFWRALRKTDYYRTLIGAGIDSFFDKYGDLSLAELLEDLGISRPMMIAEAMRYAPHVLKALNRKKMLEPLIRRNLESFYHSAAAQAILNPT